MENVRIKKDNCIPRSEVAGIVPKKRLGNPEFETNQDFGWDSCREEILTRLKKIGIEI